MVPAIPSMTGGAGGASGPSTSMGGQASGSTPFNDSGFTVNYAPSIGVGGGSMPSWVWIAAAVAGVLWFSKRK